MTHEVFVTARAAADVTKACDWIARDSTAEAIRWHDRCTEAIASLAEYPRRCPVAVESESVGLDVRQLHFGRYRILFIIEGQTVKVVHVRHGARRAFGRADLGLS